MRKLETIEEMTYQYHLINIPETITRDMLISQLRKVHNVATGKINKGLKEIGCLRFCSILRSGYEE